MPAPGQGLIVSQGPSSQGKKRDTRWLHERAKGKAPMNEDAFDKQPLTPASHEEAAGHTTPQLPETPVSRPGEATPVTQTRGRGKVPRWLLLTLIGVLALAVLASGLGVWASLGQRPTKQASRPVATAFHPAPCPFGGVAGVVEGRDVRCGYLVVPEDHSRPGGPTLRLAVAIFKSSDPHPADPVLQLVGGPGSSALQFPGPRYTAASLTEWPRDRDLILLDQRGTGYSQPSLACPELNTMANATFLQELRACHDRLVREGVNLNAYTTIQNAADVHDLVRALGYRQVNLYGISYGTRLALTVMRLFPADLRSVVLDSVVPPQNILSAGQTAADQQALDTLFHGCAASTACNQKYPHLQAVFAQLVTELTNKPATVHVRDPRTGQLVPSLLTGDDLVTGVLSALSSTNIIPKLPALIYQVRNHDYAAFLELNAASPPASAFSWGMFNSVECSEDMEFTTPQGLQASVQGLAPEYRHAVLATLQQVYEVCQIWRVQPVPLAQKQAVTSAIPTLILSGQYDPATPPAYGKLAARTLSKSYFFLFPDASHILLYTNACADSIILAFQESPTKQPDASCLQSLGPPPFE